MSVKVSIIRPRIVRWVRERLGLSEGAMADCLNIKPERLIGMENGTYPVSMTKAKELAALVLKPVEMLMGSSPPVFKPGVVDFRTVRNKEMTSASVQLEATLLHAQECQTWYADMREENGYAPFHLSSCISLQTPVEEAAAKVSEALGISDSERAECKDANTYFRTIVKRIEDNNVLVMQNGNVGNNTSQKLDADEFRGFALSDKYAPLIFVNASDYANARTFTLIHEFVHLLLGCGGVSPTESNCNPPNKIERYCNAVASEYLLPKEKLLGFCRSSGQIDYDKLKRFAMEQKISFAVVVISALKNRLISSAQFDVFYAKYRKACKDAADRKREKLKSGKNGPPFQVVAVKRFGRPFIKAILTEVRFGNLKPSEACHLLSVKKIKTAESLGAYVWGKESL